MNNSGPQQMSVTPVSQMSKSARKRENLQRRLLDPNAGAISSNSNTVGVPDIEIKKLTETMQAIVSTMQNVGANASATSTGKRQRTETVLEELLKDVRGKP